MERLFLEDLGVSEKLGVSTGKMAGAA